MPRNNHLLAVILWMSAIFLFSTELFASSNTSSFLGPFLAALFPSLTADQLDSFHLLLRKFGHWSEYALLGMLLMRAVSGQFPLWQKTRQCIYALAIATLYAASDEWHQSLVPSRSASITDVLIDSFGALCAVIWYSRRQSNADSSRNQAKKT